MTIGIKNHGLVTGGSALATPDLDTVSVPNVLPCPLRAFLAGHKGLRRTERTTPRFLH